MEARKFIERNKLKEGDKTYLVFKYETIDIEIKKDDWNWLFDNMMNSDEEIAYNNGFFMMDGIFQNIECNNVLKKVNKWLNGIKEDEEKFDDYNDAFIQNYKRIKKILEDNKNFVIYYSNKENDK